MRLFLLLVKLERNIFMTKIFTKFKKICTSRTVGNEKKEISGYHGGRNMWSRFFSTDNRRKIDFEYNINRAKHQIKTNKTPKYQFKQNNDFVPLMAQPEEWLSNPQNYTTIVETVIYKNYNHLLKAKSKNDKIIFDKDVIEHRKAEQVKFVDQLTNVGVEIKGQKIILNGTSKYELHILIGIAMAFAKQAVNEFSVPAEVNKSSLRQASKLDNVNENEQRKADYITKSTEIFIEKLNTYFNDEYKNAYIEIKTLFENVDPFPFNVLTKKKKRQIYLYCFRVSNTQRRRKI